MRELSESISPGLARKLAVIRLRGHAEHRREMASWPSAVDLLPEVERDGMAAFAARTHAIETAGQRTLVLLRAMGDERRARRQREA